MPYNNLKTIVQTDDHVVIVVEWMHWARVIRLDSQHAPADMLSMSGDSIGWWEGDTLVVETTNFLERPGVPRPGLKVIERFTRFDRDTLLSRTIARLMNLRSRWTGMMTGDQALFVRTSTFRTLGGFAAIPLMEDLELSRRLKRAGTVAALRIQVVTSYRRWAHCGPIRTIVRMWGLRLLYWLGVSPHRLARYYRPVR